MPDLSSVHRSDFLDQTETQNQIDGDNEPSDLIDHNELLETSLSDKGRVTDTQEMCNASIIARLQSSGVTTSVVTSVVADLEELVYEMHSNIKSDVMNLLPADDFATTSKMEDCFNNLDNPLTHLSSEHKWKKYFKEKWAVVDPIEIKLGVKYDSRLNRVTRTYDQVPVTDTFIYIPLLDTLQFIIRNADIYKHMSKPSGSTNVCALMLLQ